MTFDNDGVGLLTSCLSAIVHDSINVRPAGCAPLVFINLEFSLVFPSTLCFNHSCLLKGALVGSGISILRL